MPELPEVETIVRKLRPLLCGRRIVEVDVLWARTVDRPSLEQFQEGLLGAVIEALERRGKYLLVALDTRKTVLIHLRMSGKFVFSVGVPQEDKHARLRLRLDDGSWLVFVDMRKFGRFYLVEDPEEITAGLGPEPLEASFSAEVLEAALRGSRREIKALLLDQTVVAGLGNIYVSEALWRAGIHPQRKAASLTSDECRDLRMAIVEVIERSLADGGTSLEDRQYRYPDGGLGNHQVHLRVYDRAGDVCFRCGAQIERIVQGQRSTYLCPGCQRMG